jgi:uroporphyrinogen-III synthase
VRPRVLNTRPREQAAELSRLLRQAGFDAIEAPAVAISQAWDAAELANVRQELRARRFEWVVLPSQNAARQLRDELSGARILCGAATAQVLGINADVVLARFSAGAALAALESSVVPGTRLLVPRAAEGRDELVAGLHRLGANVSAPIAYRTMPAPDAAQWLREGRIDVVTLCSPSAARSVGAVPPKTVVVCLGDTTAEAARGIGLSVDAVAATTSMAALVAAVQLAVRSVHV